MTRDDEMVWRAAAVELVLELREAVLAAQPTETVSLADVAGRTLAMDLVAERNQPPVSRSTMDGYTFDATDDYPLVLRDEELFPEDEPPAPGSGEAVRIFTGAPLPSEANAVLKQEPVVVEHPRLASRPLPRHREHSGRGRQRRRPVRRGRMTPNLPVVDPTESITDEVREHPVAGVLFAAGMSSRFGESERFCRKPATSVRSRMRISGKPGTHTEMEVR